MKTKRKMSQDEDLSEEGQAILWDFLHTLQPDTIMCLIIAIGVLDDQLTTDGHVTTDYAISLHELWKVLREEVDIEAMEKALKASGFLKEDKLCKH